MQRTFRTSFDPSFAASDHKIMVVDDNAAYLETISKILESWGYKVLPISCGMAALEALEEASPSLVIIDYLMPEMDGLELLRKLREVPAGRDVPAIFLTASDVAALRKPAVALDASAVISKTAPPDDLATAIQVAMHSREAS